MDAESLPSGLRWVDTGNAGPFTLGGTRSYVVDHTRVAVVDPGPDVCGAALPSMLEGVACASLAALVEHIRSQGR